MGHPAYSFFQLQKTSTHIRYCVAVVVFRIDGFSLFVFERPVVLTELFAILERNSSFFNLFDLLHGEISKI